MLDILVAWGILSVFIWVGLCGLYVIRGFLTKVDDEAFYPAVLPIGAAFLVGITQTLNIFMPARWVAIVWAVVFAATIYWLRETIEAFFRYVVHHLFFPLLAVGVSVLYSIPALRIHGLVAVQNSNNDIAYYLASMDWLQGHRSIQTITFSSSHPYFFLARQIVGLTRFGMDGLGAVLMTFFGLASYQIYLSLSIAGIVTAVCTAAFFLHTCLKLSKRVSAVGTVLASVGGWWAFLVVSQYMPQIFGIAFLTAFTGTILKMVQSNEAAAAPIVYRICGVYAAATLAVYCEYTVYLVGIAGITLLYGAAIRLRTPHQTGRLLFSTGKALVWCVLTDPYGIFVAVRTDLNLVFASMRSTQNINPYSPSMNQGSFIGKIIRYMEPGFWNIGQPGFGWVKRLTALVLLVALALFLIGFVKRRGGMRFCVLTILFFLFGLEWVFHKQQLAYEEMKNTTTLVLPAVLLYIWMVAGWRPLHRVGRAGMCVTKWCVAILVLLCGTISIRSQYDLRQLQYWDSSIGQIKRAVSRVPVDTPIAVTSLKPYDKHLLVYALKDRAIAQPMTLGYDFSYYNQNPAFLHGSSAYYLMDVSEISSWDSQWQTVLWQNEKFALIYTPTLQIEYGEGFGPLQNVAPESFRVIDTRGTKLSLHNYSDEEQKIQVNISFHDVNIADSLVVQVDQNRIGLKSSSYSVRTEALSIPPGKAVTMELMVGGTAQTVRVDSLTVQKVR